MQRISWLRINDMIRSKPTARGFGSGSTTASVAEASPRHSGLAKSSARAARRLLRIRAGILYIETYNAPALNWARMVISSVLDLESALLLWRTRHARVAERVIGRRVGTGGGSVSYLDQTLGLRVFTDFWAARTHVLPHHFAPLIQQLEPK